MNGQVIDFSAADVAAIAAAYDPELHEAPHVVGHPRTDDPAFGWVRALGVNDAGRLCVTESRQVEPAFAEAVGAGRYKKRSASFYPPSHANNPTPGQWYLKHVGWLGAMPPAVKGLADVASYGQADDGLVEFAGWDDEINAGLWRRMREWFIGQFGAETADKVIPAYEVDSLQREAMRPEPDTTVSTTPAYADTGATAVTMTAEQLAARAAELDAREARIRQQETDQQRLVTQAHQAGLAAFADGLIVQGQLLPGERALVLIGLQGADAQGQVAFGEGDQAEQITPLAALQKFLKGLPKRVDFSERAPRHQTGDTDTVDLADGNAIAVAATAWQAEEAKAGRVVGIDAAVQHIVTTTKQQER